MVEEYPCGQEEYGAVEEHAPAWVFLFPLEVGVDDGVFCGWLDGCCFVHVEVLNEGHDDGDDEEHLDRRVAYLSSAADVVAYEVAWSQQELEYGIAERSVVESPEEHELLSECVPCDAVCAGPL